MSARQRQGRASSRGGPLVQRRAAAPWPPSPRRWGLHVERAGGWLAVAWLRAATLPVTCRFYCESHGCSAAARLSARPRERSDRSHARWCRRGLTAAAAAATARCRRRLARPCALRPPPLPQFKIEPFKHPLKLDPNYAGVCATAGQGSAGATPLVGAGRCPPRRRAHLRFARCLPCCAQRTRGSCWRARSTRSTTTTPRG